VSIYIYLSILHYQWEVEYYHLNLTFYLNFLLEFFIIILIIIVVAYVKFLVIKLFIFFPFFSFFKFRLLFFSFQFSKALLMLSFFQSNLSYISLNDLCKHYRQFSKLIMLLKSNQFFFLKIQRMH